MKQEEFAKGYIKKSILVKYDEGSLFDVSKHSKIILIRWQTIKTDGNCFTVS
ncbi:MAG: hypothetical protein RI100_04540 [Nitrosarchaeum sp.]|uniref:hypothetical protein n=1 Tax=Nitrosarchaeum sp. TaxID=2026886 RepID=UPI002DF362B2|nr:hypothetical protein [Nitrosarchaeum sp.]